MSPLTRLVPRLYFSYRQFLVYDSGIRAPGCLWTDAHTAQGFARRESNVAFATLLEFGYADVFWRWGEFQCHETFERAIAVPFAVFSGKVVIDGPEEIGVERIVELPVGNYRLVAAQRAAAGQEEVIGLFVEKVDTALGKSAVVIADALLSPPAELIETAEVA